MATVGAVVKLWRYARYFFFDVNLRSKFCDSMYAAGLAIGNKALFLRNSKQIAVFAQQTAVACTL